MPGGRATLGCCDRCPQDISSQGPGTANAAAIARRRLLKAAVSRPQAGNASRSHISAGADWPRGTEPVSPEATVEAGFANSDFDFWVGAFVPKQTPRDLVARIHRETVAAIESLAVHDKLAKFGVEPMLMSPEDFDARVAKEAGIAVKLAKAANITPQSQ